MKSKLWLENIEYILNTFGEEREIHIYMERAQLLLPHAHVTAVALFSVSGFTYCFQSRGN